MLGIFLRPFTVANYTFSRMLLGIFAILNTQKLLGWNIGHMLFGNCFTNLCSMLSNNEFSGLDNEELIQLQKKLEALEARIKLAETSGEITIGIRGS